MSAIAVFCGASDGNHPAFFEAAEQVGKALARSNITMVYGGGTKGIMGKCSSTYFEAGGTVKGVIPRAFLSDEVADPNRHERNEEIPVSSMHERKKLMSDLSRAFIGLPGGYGTLEEVMEMVTWTQLGIRKFFDVSLEDQG